MKEERKIKKFIKENCQISSNREFQMERAAFGKV